MNCNYLFIYGTLMRKLRGNLFFDFEKHNEYMGEASYRGKMFEIRGYPGVVPGKGTERVYGEVYKILNHAFMVHHLDTYEGCVRSNVASNEYVRKMVYVTRQSGLRTRCWMYLYNQPIHHYTCIAGGNYTRFVQSKKGH